MWSTIATHQATRAWLLAGVVSVAGACHPPSRPTLLFQVEHPKGPSCLVSKGCPPPTPIPPCAADLVAQPLSEVLARPELNGQSVAVRGPLRRGSAICTLLGCMSSDPAGACCNKCSGALALGSEEALHDRDYQRMRKSTLMLTGPGVGCQGDESLVCCAADAHGQDVIARGKLIQHGVTWVLEQTELCLPVEPR